MSKIKQYMQDLDIQSPLIKTTENTEIERKFLVVNNTWKQFVTGTSEIYQKYLSINPAIRVRMKKGEATLTIKSSNAGMTRSEFEYKIPHTDAVDIFEVFDDNDTITKIRHILLDDKTGLTWEIDEFRGNNSGLVIAEIELSNEDDIVNLNHSWLGEEVTNDERYYNSYLSQHPFKTW